MMKIAFDCSMRNTKSCDKVCGKYANVQGWFREAGYGYFQCNFICNIPVLSLTKGLWESGYLAQPQNVG